ncbi:ABC transporter permease [Nocardiopsis exhalans]|uniref:ABC transporter permease n=1 Tax=Nocardiopsis exhalans TaxID=163604 RepID=A0ABY5D6T6_9ACTN|nr:ABC transporter permease [Nocardiopsis exhalans]USY19075.1 ABC transporter permease [Nocardiopsis exhalans]
MSPGPLPRTRRLGLADLFRVGSGGLRSRPTRVVLSALGIAIGIAALISVVGISESSRSELNDRLDALGTNLLRAGPGENLLGERSVLPDQAVAMIDRLPPVESTVAVGRLDASVYRSDLIPPERTGSIAVIATDLELRERVGLEMATGQWLNTSSAQLPTVVLGSRAADRLGIGADGVGQRVWLGDQWFTVTGVLEPVLLAPELETAALVGWPIAESALGSSGDVTTIYTRVAPGQVEEVREVLAASANPENPGEVEVSRPSEALEAQQAVDATLAAMLLGLGGVSLLVGGVGVANTMVISVLERRQEIGLRRALGATRGDIRAQFLAESLLLSLLGGAAGTLLGAGVTAVYSLTQGWSPTLPVWAVGLGIGATLLIGCAAGLYPAVRASLLAPTEALAAN